MSFRATSRLLEHASSVTRTKKAAPRTKAARPASTRPRSRAPRPESGQAAVRRRDAEQDEQTDRATEGATSSISPRRANPLAVFAHGLKAISKATSRSTPGPELYPPRPPPLPDLSALPRLSAARPKIHFRVLDHESTISAFHRPSTPATPTIMFRDRLIQMRAVKTDTLPPAPSSPFPASPLLPSYTDRHPGTAVIPFNVIASKGNVSKLATERMRVRKRFKAAVDGVIRRSWGLRPDQAGVDLVRPDWSYLAILDRAVYTAHMDELVKSVAGGLIWIKRLQDKGIGTDRHRPTVAKSIKSGPTSTPTPSPTPPSGTAR